MSTKSWSRAAVMALSLAAMATGCSRADDPSGTPDADGGAGSAAVSLDATSQPPWDAPTDDVAARAAAAGLDLGPMGTAEHYHPRLTLRIRGAVVPIPPNIGVDPRTGAMSALHTHEADGTIHIEADSTGERFTLGQLFTQWGVKLSATQIGGVRASSGKTVTVTSNGKVVAGDPAALPLAPDQEIVVELP